MSVHKYRKENIVLIAVLNIFTLFKHFKLRFRVENKLSLLDIEHI